MTVTGTVTGRMGDMPITNGKVTADTISFDVVRNMNGNSITISYAGKADGDTIKFTRTFGGGGMGGGGNGGPPPPVEFTATRAPAGAPAPPPAQ
jgi:hypothetical protein